jgi:hypothetical protein
MNVDANVILGIPWIESLEQAKISVDGLNRKLRFRHSKKAHEIHCHKASVPDIDKSKQYFDIISAEDAEADLQFLKEHDPETYAQSFLISLEKTLEGAQATSADEMDIFVMYTDDEEQEQVYLVNKSGKVEKQGSFEHRAEGYVDPDEQDTMPEMASLREEILEKHKETAVNELPSEFAGNANRPKCHIRIVPAKIHETPYRKPYRMNPTAMKQLRQQVQELLDKGHIQPSSSPYGAPALMVPKPHQPDTWRLCVDYRGLNEITVRDRYAIPTVSGIMDRLHGSKIFSTLDLIWGFWQIEVDPEDVEKTAFVTEFGSYEWKCMPMGLKNSPSTFQRIMRKALGEFEFVEVYIDDILIHSTDVETHKQHLEAVLNRLKQEGLFVKRSKCNLFQTRVKFLGHVLTGEGVQPQHNKTEAVQNWPPLKNQSQVRQFLGLTGYYRSFIPDYAEIAKPLFDLTKKDIDKDWESMSPEATAAFEALKAALCSSPVLILPDQEAALHDSPYFVVPDVSQVAVGAVLMQDQGKGLQPISYESKALTPAQQNWSTTDRELYGVVHACEIWRHYLQGTDFRVIGDHLPLEALFSPAKELNRRQARWIETLIDVGMERLIHVAGAKLVPSDCFSRRPDYEAASPNAGIQELLKNSPELRKRVERLLQDQNELSQPYKPDGNSLRLSKSTTGHQQCPECWQTQCTCAKHEVNGISWCNATETEDTIIKGLMCQIATLPHKTISRQERKRIRQAREELSDNQDWTFDRHEFLTYHQRYGPFEVDACSDVNGSNSFCGSGIPGQFYSKLNSCIQNNCKGKRVWMNMPFNDPDLSVETILKWFAKCQLEDPGNTSAVVVLPHWAVPPTHRLKALGLGHMSFIRSYPEGSTLFTSQQGHSPECKWDVHVYRIPPLTEVDSSQAVTEPSVLPTATAEETFLTAVRKAQQEDAFCMKRFQELNESNRYSAKGFCLKANLLWRIASGRYQLVVPNDQLQEVVLQEAHDVPGAGHLGFHKTVHRVTKSFWWPGCTDTIKRWVAECPTCQVTKTMNHTAGQQGVYDTPAAPWQVVTMDFITGLPKTARGYDAIVTFTDSLTKMVHVVPLAFDGSSAQVVARIFIDSIWRLHGCPSKLISDRDPRFTSAFWQSVSQQLGIRHSCTSAYNPAADGQSEVTNRTLEQILRAYTGPRQNDWDLRLPTAEFAMNDAVHTVTGFSPFYLNYGRHPANNIDLLSQALRQQVEHRVNPMAERFFDQLKLDLETTRHAIDAAKRKAKARADERRKPVHYKPGDQVLLNSTSFTSPAHRDTKWKLRPKYYGPFEVISVMYDDADNRLPFKERGVPSAYKLRLPPAWRIHDVFNPHKLKPFKANTFHSRNPPPESPTQIVEGDLEHVVEEILDHRRMYNRRTKRHETHWLIHWKDFTHEHDEWLPESDINAGMPNQTWLDYNADNKVNLNIIKGEFSVHTTSLNAVVIDNKKVLPKRNLTLSYLAQEYRLNRNIYTMQTTGPNTGTAQKLRRSKRCATHLAVNFDDKSNLVKLVEHKRPLDSIITLNTDAREGAYTHTVDLTEWVTDLETGEARGNYQSYAPSHFEYLWMNLNEQQDTSAVMKAITKLNIKHYVLVSDNLLSLPDHERQYVTQIQTSSAVITTSCPIDHLDFGYQPAIERVLSKIVMHISKNDDLETTKPYCNACASPVGMQEEQ